MTITIGHLQPIIALIAGVLILIMPRLLNFIVAIYLIAIGLLVLCLVNVAGLLAARFLRRSSEYGVRRVLGAPRRAIIATCLVESTLAGLLGGLLALPLTLAGLWLMRQQGDAYAPLARLDLPLFTLLLLLALLTGVLVGLLPALRAARQEPALQVKTL